jgi:hypothetical protein
MFADSESVGAQVEQVAPVSDVQPKPEQDQSGATTPSLTPEQIEIALASDVAKRKIQSEVDRARAKLQAEQLRLQRAEEDKRKADADRAAEQAKVAEMSDEEYGAYLREKQQQETAAQALATQRDQMHYEAMLKLVPEEERPAFMQRAHDGVYKSEEEFLMALSSRHAELLSPKEKEKEVIREAARREATAEAANAGQPTLGTSLPRQTVESNLSSYDLLRLGVQEEMEKVRKR